MTKVEDPIGATTLTGVAVAVVAISRFLATEQPKFPDFLDTVLKNARSSGIAPKDLELLQTLVQSLVSRQPVIK